MSRKLRHRSHHGHAEEEPAQDHHEQLLLLAHELWEKRGKPVGSPEEDWFEAERQLDAATRL